MQILRLKVKSATYMAAEVDEQTHTGLSAFELERLENIKKNRAVLESLGLASRASRVGSATRASKQSKPRANKRQVSTVTLLAWSIHLEDPLIGRLLV
jgi:hypothetical protein